MPVNRNALIRYKTIDKCLQNRYRRWTLEDLIKACSDALYEYEGITRPIGTRTIQADIQIMRSDKLGYNAPIKVVERKYYTYEDPEYSITNIPLADKDLQKLSEIVELLKQFKSFSHFKELELMIQKLEDTINSEKTQTRPLIDMEKNENLKGLDLLEPIYRAILQRQVLEIEYQSFKAKHSGKILFHPYILKEYRNRWFVLGRKSKDQPILTLALDRIGQINIAKQVNYFYDEHFDINEYYKNSIGVTVNSNRPVNIHLFVDKTNAPYILTKPLHSSQQLINEDENGIEIVIKVIPNFELEREIMGFGENMKVLAPESLRKRIQNRLSKSLSNYSG